MEIGEILSYVGTAVGAGGLTQIVNWRYSRKKNAADVKRDEIENLRSTIEGVYKPLIEQQNERIRQLEGEVSELRQQLTAERHDHQRQIDGLQKQIVEITKALGIRANKQVRDVVTGQFVRKAEEAAIEEEPEP